MKNGLNQTKVFGRHCSCDDKDYKQKNPNIYVKDDHPCRSHPHLGIRATNQYDVVRILLYRLFKSKTCLLERHPSKAQLFFIPMYPGPNDANEWSDICANSSSSSLTRPSLPRLRYLNSKTAPFHFFLIGKGYVTCLDWMYDVQDPLIRQVTRLSYGNIFEQIGLDARSIRGENKTSSSPYGPFDDSDQVNNITHDKIKAPHSISIPYPSSIHWSSNIRDRLEPWKMPSSSSLSSSSSSSTSFDHQGIRTYLVSYSGSFRNCSHGHLRPHLRKIFDSCPTTKCHSVLKEDFFFIAASSFSSSTSSSSKDSNSSSNGNSNKAKCAYVEVKKRSVFCLEPGGDSPWRKSLYDSITAGCIPVLFSPYNLRVAPMHWGPIAHRASVYINIHGVMNGSIDLIHELESISKARVLGMQRVISKHGHSLHYALDDYENDAVEIMLKGVYRYGRERSSRSNSSSSSNGGDQHNKKKTTAAAGVKKRKSKASEKARVVKIHNNTAR